MTKSQKEEILRRLGDAQRQTQHAVEVMVRAGVGTEGTLHDAIVAIQDRYDEIIATPTKD